MRLSGLNTIPLAEATLANLSKSSAQAATSLRGSRFAAHFQAYSASGMARLHAGHAALPGASIKVRQQLAHLQARLLAQWQTRMATPGGLQSAIYSRMSGTSPGVTSPFTLPFGGRFANTGAFYHPSGMQLHWNSVDPHGRPMQTTMNLQTGTLNTQTPWTPHDAKGVQRCHTWDHASGKSWAWEKNAGGLSTAADAWAQGADGKQRRNMFLFVPGRAPTHFTDEVDPASGRRQIHSDWSPPDAHGRQSRISIDPASGKTTLHHQGPVQAAPPTDNDTDTGKPKPPPLTKKEQELKNACAAFGLAYGEQISDEAFARTRKDYRKSALQHHPDKIRQELGESDPQFAARKEQAAEQFKTLSHNYEMIENEYHRQTGK